MDELYWRKLSRIPRGKWHPEAELIKYEVEDTAYLIEFDDENGECCRRVNLPKPGIGPHVDNASVITIVAMLSQRNEYEGGYSCFENVPKEKPRVLTLQQGDLVLFRGELTEHWITDVDLGRRVILQIECCRMKKGRH